MKTRNGTTSALERKNTNTTLREFGTENENATQTCRLVGKPNSRSNQIIIYVMVVLALSAQSARALRHLRCPTDAVEHKRVDRGSERNNVQAVRGHETEQLGPSVPFAREEHVCSCEIHSLRFYSQLIYIITPARTPNTSSFCCSSSSPASGTYVRPGLQSQARFRDIPEDICFLFDKQKV